MSTINLDLIQGIDLGKRFLPKHKWQQWINFVTVSYSQNYKIEHVGLLLKYFKALNSDDSIRVIYNMIKDDFVILDDTSVIEVLIYCARFHERGVDLLEYMNDILSLDIAPSLITDLKMMRELSERGEISAYDTSLADSEALSIQFGDDIFNVLLNDNNRFYGITGDNRLVFGALVDDYVLLYLLDASSYHMFVGNTNQSIILDKFNLVDVKRGVIINRLDNGDVDLFIRYGDIRRIYQYQNINILLTIMEELEGFGIEGDFDVFKRKIDEIFRFYQDEIVKLIKSTD